MNRPLKEHYEMDTDAGTMLAIFDYANDLEKYANFLEQQVKNLNIPAVIKSVCEHDVRNFKDRQECEKCGEIWIRQ